MNKTIELVDNRLEELLKAKRPEILYESMAYSIFAGGKRIRPLLMLYACEAVGGNLYEALDFACALEMIHTYSLIHDDLPALDNDDFRRGRETNHIRFGEDIAIVAGDGLLHYAFEIMISKCLEQMDKRFLLASDYIARFSGTRGMVVGQVEDMISEGKQISGEDILFIHEHKTAGLIKAALMAGAAIGGADYDELSRLEEVGLDIGIAYQIKDDILDVTADSQVLGKPVGSDAKNEKSTYVTVYGMEKAKNDYERFSLDAIKKVKMFGEKSQRLTSLVESLVNREK